MSNNRIIESKDLIVFVFLALAGFVCVLNFTPIRTGDGYEYLLQVHAFADHGSPDIKASDIEGLLQEASTFKVLEFEKETLRTMKEEMASGKEQLSWGLFKSFTGAYYGYHFFFYAALGAPIKILLDRAGANPFKALQILNFLLFVGSIAVCLFFIGFERRTRIFLASLYFFSGTTFYLGWTHPEILIAAGIFLSSLFIVDRRYSWAILFSALGAVQNPGAIVIGLFAALLGLYESKSLRLRLRRAVQYFLIGTIALIPFLFYYWKFLKTSLIASSGFVSSANINPRRYLELWFDPNYGLVCGMPWVILGLFPLVFLFIAGKGKGRHPGDCWRLGALLLSAILTPLIFLSQVNWNHGQAVFLRYSMFMGIQLLVFLVVLSDRVKWGRVIVVLAIIGQAFHVIAYGFYTNVDQLDYLRHKPIARLLLRSAPDWYDPDPEVFIERTLHAEVFCEMEFPTSFKEKGLIWKAIVNSKKSEGVAECLRTQGVSFSKGSERRCTNQVWTYFNFREGLLSEECLKQ